VEIESYLGVDIPTLDLVDLPQNVFNFLFDQISRFAEFVEWQMFWIGNFPFFSPLGPDKRTLVAATHRSHQVVFKHQEYP
jgi:hypothetical protein